MKKWLTPQERPKIQDEPGSSCAATQEELKTG